VPRSWELAAAEAGLLVAIERDAKRVDVD